MANEVSHAAYLGGESRSLAAVCTADVSNAARCADETDIAADALEARDRTMFRVVLGDLLAPKGEGFALLRSIWLQNSRARILADTDRQGRWVDVPRRRRDSRRRAGYPGRRGRSATSVANAGCRKKPSRKSAARCDSGEAADRFSSSTERVARRGRPRRWRSNSARVLGARTNPASKGAGPSGDQQRRQRTCRGGRGTCRDAFR
jgi:hypothetical protein